MAKKWYKIKAPKVFNSVDVGKSFADEKKELIGKTISVPLSNLLRDRRKQHFIVKLEITNVGEKFAHTKVKSYKVSRTHLVRYVRRRRSRVDAVEDVETKDGKKIRIKAVVISAFKAKKKQKKSLRKELSDYLKKRIKNLNLDSLLLSVAVGKFQIKIKKKLSKVYPLRYAEIRAIEIK